MADLYFIQYPQDFSLGLIANADFINFDLMIAVEFIYVGESNTSLKCIASSRCDVTVFKGIREAMVW